MPDGNFPRQDHAVAEAEAGSDRRAEVQAESRLYDACIGAGMSHDEPNHMEWAGRRIAAWLFSAPFRTMRDAFAPQP